jgi:hypothetical protein
VPSAESIAEAFNLGRPVAQLTQVQHTVSRSWRLDTRAGSFHVKQFWADDDPEWAPQLLDRMEFERLAMTAGIGVVRPIDPVTSAYGLAGRVEGRGAYRVYEWVDNRPLSPDDDIADWLGGTLAQLHRLRPIGDPPDLALRWFVSHPRARWESWIATGVEQGKQWTSIARERLGDILELGRRDDRAFLAAADHVITHRDIEPYNVIMTVNGPILIDWDSVGPESATVETGHAAITFGYDDPDRAHHILDAYTSAGGQLSDLGGDLLIRTAARQTSDIVGLIRYSLGLRPPAGWMTPIDADQRITEWLTDLPGLIASLSKTGTSYLRSHS